ncbi:FMN-binding negative transcriptional regulator [Amniculibacterium aquaticum]|uniref:FMN-binding negative transcriptional regulator n=2 Tax=Amniculibacterium TaxID=2715289 RepID=UPI000F592FE3|nr:FMN-binding negative transcriptional regulator [Amniculibacterium aquaticum]
MHIPKPYRTENREVMKKIIAENGFALIISSKEKIRATHSMLLWNEENIEKPFVEAHISMTNPQAKEINNGDVVLCDFLGKHTYISSSWYNHINASTWNYEAVQIYGTVELMTDAELKHHLDKLTNKYENHQKCPMTLEKMGNDFINKAMKGAFGFKIYPTEIYIAQKMSQNRNQEDYENIIHQLEESSSKSDLEVAEIMKHLKN